MLILLLLLAAGAIFHELYSDRPGGEKLPPEISRPAPKQHGARHREVPREGIPRETLPTVRETPRTEPPVPAPEKAVPVPPVQAPGLRVAILIDDIGTDLAPVKKLLKIDAPVSFAILPHSPRSVAAAEMIHQSGRDILLHLPMEPQGYPKEKPGPGALFTDMNEQELRQILSRNLDAVPHVSGVNNHMGSRFTEDKEKMALVMKELKKRGLFFIDSRTTPGSIAAQTSQDVGIPFASRQIFIDNGRNYQITSQTLLKVLSSAKGGHRGVILIGHPHDSTVSALATVIPELKSRGVVLVPVSHMVQ